MAHDLRRRVAWIVCWICGAASIPGCDSRTASTGRFTPQAGVARAAVEAALTAWQRGEPPGGVSGSSRPVQLVDTHRRAEQQLHSFEIIGEVGGYSGRCFAVRLTLNNPSEEQKVRFVVFGLSPLWVFREEDYTMLTHWEHAMPGDAPVETETETKKNES